MIKVKVTQKHIDNGVAGCVNSCPIALALKEKKYKNVSVTVSFSQFIMPGKKRYRRSENPKEAQMFVYNFDRRLKVKPFEFVLKKHECIN